MAGRESGKDRGRERDAEDPERKLHYAVREVEPGDAATDQERSDQGVDLDVYLGDRRAEDRGQNQSRDASHSFVRPAQPGHDEQPQRRQEGEQEDELRHPGHEHPRGEGEDRLLHVRREQESGSDEGNVEQRGSERGHSETTVSVQHARRERGQRYEEEIGERDTQQLNRERVLVALPHEAGSEYDDQDGRREHPERAHQQQNRPEDTRHAGDELTHLVMLALLPVLGEHRHEGLRKGPFREEAPQQIGEPEGDEERIGLPRCAEGARDDDVAHEAEDPRSQGAASGPRRRTEQGAVYPARSIEFIAVALHTFPVYPSATRREIHWQIPPKHASAPGRQAGTAPTTCRFAPGRAPRSRRPSRPSIRVTGLPRGPLSGKRFR